MGKEDGKDPSDHVDKGVARIISEYYGRRKTRKTKTPTLWRKRSVSPEQARDAFANVLDKMTKKATATAFGLWGDYPSMPRKINKLLKPFGLKLKVKSNREWGDQVEVSIEGNEALTRIKCPNCEGNGIVTSGGGLIGEYDEKCKACFGTGMHPIVRKILKS
jgi:hypothetical protein